MTCENLLPSFGGRQTKLAPASEEKAANRGRGARSCGPLDHGLSFNRIQGMIDGGLLAQSYELGQHSHKVIG